MNKIQILFLAANPVDTDPLDLDREVEAITKELTEVGTQDNFTFVEERAIKADDVSLRFLKVKPDIVHFSGHGSRASEIYLLGESGKSVPVGPKVISMLFKALKGKIRCVVLNACFSEVQALVISKYVDCVIGMTREIGDEAAIKFAQGFYRGLGNGTDVKTAFDLGCFQIGTHFPDEHTTPRIIWKDDKQKIIVFGQSPPNSKISYKEHPFPARPQMTNVPIELDARFSEINMFLSNYIDEPSSLNERKAWRIFKEFMSLLEKFSSEFEIEDEFTELKEIKMRIARLRTKRDENRRSGYDVSKTEAVILRNYNELNERIKEIMNRL